MVRRFAPWGLALVIVALGSCAHPAATPSAPTPSAGAPRAGTGVAAAPAAPTPTAAAPAQGGPPGGPPGAGGPPRRVPLTPEQRAARRDSLAIARAQVVKGLMEKLAGKEKMKAGDVFANVQMLQDTTVEALLTIMDQNYSKALGVSCTFCHTNGQWDEDKKEEKESTRLMIKMVTQINKEQLTKMPPNRAGKTPTIDCVTCHRGLNHPNQAILP
ncbi:MAG: c-type cytochrome [Gemmatimonadota bacterium]